MEFVKPNISYKPIEVDVENIASAEKISQQLSISSDIDETANTLMDHLAIIQDFNNRIDSIEWLIDNAKKLAGNLKYVTTDQGIIKAIKDLGGDGNYVDIRLFELSIDMVIEGYKQQALISLTGAKN